MIQVFKSQISLESQWGQPVTQNFQVSRYFGCVTVSCHSARVGISGTIPGFSYGKIQPFVKDGWDRVAFPLHTKTSKWCWWMRSSTWASNVHLQPRKPAISWAASREAWPAGQRKCFCPSALLWWDLPRSPVSSSGAPSTGQTWTCWCGAREGHKNDLRVGTSLLWGQAGRAGAVQPGEEKALGSPYCGLSVLKGVLSERWGQSS